MKRGEVNFGEPSGPEQAGIRPAIVLQNDSLSPYVATGIVIPLTTKTKRLSIPKTVFLPAGEAGLPEDSVFIASAEVEHRALMSSMCGLFPEGKDSRPLGWARASAPKRKAIVQAEERIRIASLGALFE